MKIKLYNDKFDIPIFCPKEHSKLALATSTLNKQPINGLRLNPENGTNGWYIWCGEEFSTRDDFFEPLHYMHIDKYLPQIKYYLSLPVGYRFQIDNNGYEDVWFDNNLLK